jgi:hypothetical protein
MRAYAGKKTRATKKARAKKKAEAEAEKKRRARARARKPAKKSASTTRGAKAQGLSRKPRNQVTKRQSRTARKSLVGAKRPKVSARKPKKAGAKRPQPTARPVRKPVKTLDWKAAEKLLSEKSGYEKPKPAKKPARKSTSKLDPRTKRRRQNKALVKRVDRLEDKRQRNRRKTLSKKAKRKTAREIAQEKKRIEKLRLDRERKRLERASRGSKVRTFADEMGEKFLDLLTEAIRTGQMPKAHPNKRKMDKYEGVQSYLIVRRLIIPQNVQEIMYAVRQRLQKAFTGVQYPVWLASIHFASMGENLLGYGGRILRSDKAGEEMFTTQANDSTGIWSNRIGMLDALEALLEKYAGEGMNVVFLYHIRLMNYDPDRLRPR